MLQIMKLELSQAEKEQEKKELGAVTGALLGSGAIPGTVALSGAL